VPDWTPYVGKVVLEQAAVTRSGWLLVQRLEMVFDWYKGMASPQTGMLAYLYRPQADRLGQENCPIREIAAVWDVEVLGEFLDRPNLEPLADRSLRYFVSFLTNWDSYFILSPLLPSLQTVEPRGRPHSRMVSLGHQATLAGIRTRHPAPLVAMKCFHRIANCASVAAYPWPRTIRAGSRSYYYPTNPANRR
jgi:hypothetical protein